MSDVFISYASEDGPRAKMLAEALEASGFSVWWDRKVVAGQSYDDIIEHELDTAKSVVVLWSQHSVVSEWVKNEAQVAVERGRLVPGLIDRVKPPLEFRRKQTADLIGWDGDLGHPGFDTLRRGISVHVARESSTPTVPAPPRETRAVDADGLRPLEAATAPPAPHRAQDRRRRALVCVGAAALLIPLGAGLWVWDAFYRAHVNHHANVIKRWGAPEGIGQVGGAQASRRNLTLAFSKRGRRGPITEIRAVTSDGAYPPEFAYFPPLTLLALNPLLTEDAEVLKTCRVTFEYDRGRITKQAAYDRSDRPLYTLHYPQPDIAEYRWEVFSRVVRESGITHLKFVRPEIGPEAGLDKGVLFLDSTGTPRPDRDGSYGYRRVFGPLGLVVESIPLGAEGQPTPNPLGIAKMVTEYSELGDAIRQVNLGPDGRPVVGRSGSAEQKMRYDEHGNITERAFLGADGQPVTPEAVGVAGQTFAYDGQGNLIENAFFGPDRQPVIAVIGSAAFAKQRIVWAEKRRSLETFFGPDGKPMPVSGMAIKLKATWDKRGHLVEAAYLDENDRPARNAQGCVKIRRGRDERGHVVDVTCLDEGDRAVREIGGAARVERKFDARGNLLEETYFGPGGQLERYAERYVKSRWKYDPQGKTTEEAYFDASDRPVPSTAGYAAATYGYDVQANLREVAFFDENRRPTVRKGGYAKIVRLYDARRNVVEETLLKTDGHPARSENNYAKSRYGYDARGYVTETAYYDERDRPTSHKNGCAKVRHGYNATGQRIEWTCFGPDGSVVVARQYGYAKAIRIFDSGGRLSRIDLFDSNGDRTRSAEGYARIRYSYDEYGRPSKRQFFDINGEPVVTRVTIDKIEPESMGQHVGLQTGDVIIAYDGLEISDKQRLNELELIAGERPRNLSIERAGRILTLNLPAGRLAGIETVDQVPAARDRRSRIQQGKPG